MKEKILNAPFKIINETIDENNLYRSTIKDPQILNPENSNKILNISNTVLDKPPVRRTPVAAAYGKNKFYFSL